MKLYRSRKDRKLFGICGGMGEAFNFDSTWIRLIVVAAVIFSGGAVLLLYVLAALVIPNEPGGYGGGGWNHQQPHQPHQPHQPQQDPHHPSNLDAMFQGMETKAMRRELDELRAKLARFEAAQQNKDTTNNNQ